MSEGNRKDERVCAVMLTLKELEYVIQALFDQEQGVSALSDRLVDMYETHDLGGD